MKNQHIYTLGYLRPLPDGKCAASFIGVYSSLERAEQAIARLQKRPGFRDYPQGFVVEGCLLDADYDNPLYL